MEISEAVIILSNEIPNGFDESESTDRGPVTLQKLEEKAQKAQEAFEKEEKARKELEALNSKLLAEKTALLDSLSGEKGALQDYQEKCAKLTAQKNDLDNQLRVSS
jgi:DNA repair exonuclease SbcCD ATPase subunit